MTQSDYSPTNLKDKGVLITGGTTGIGRATASLLAAQGARVFIFGRDENALQDALKDIEKQAQGKGRVFGTTADASKAEDVRRVFKEADEKLGDINILINNAAQGAHSVVDSEYDEWRSVVETNVLGYMQCCREAIDRMKASGGGHIVNVGSLSAQVREKGSDVYVATKSAIQGFSEALRKQVNEQGIKVSLIEPGLVGTDMTVDQATVEEQPKKIEEGEMLKAEDLAQCVLYTLVQPQRCDIIEVRIRPHKQAI